MSWFHYDSHLQSIVIVRSYRTSCLPCFGHTGSRSIRTTSTDFHILWLWVVFSQGGERRDGESGVVHLLPWLPPCKVALAVCVSWPEDTAALRGLFFQAPSPHSFQPRVVGSPTIDGPGFLHQPLGFPILCPQE